MPAVLFVPSRKFDYLQDVTYAGLATLLPARDLGVSPRRLGYSVPLRRYPKNMGYVRTWPALRGGPGPAEAEVIVLAACKPDAVEAYLRLSPRLRADAVRVFIDGGDRAEVGGDLDRLGRRDLLVALAADGGFDVVLKRELLRDPAVAGGYDPAALRPSGWPDIRVDRVRSFPLAVRSDLMPAPLPERDKAFDVAFWATVSHPDRARAFEQLDGRYDCNANGSIPRDKPKDFGHRGSAYLAQLARVRVGVNVRGNGWDTLRFWEMLGCGSAVVSQRTPLVLPAAPTHGRELLWVRQDLGDLHERIGELLGDERRRAALAAAGRAWAFGHHDHRARGRQLLAAVG